jgi:hypothetical protein
MRFRRHCTATLLAILFSVLSGGCIDLVTDSVKGGVSDAISGVVASAVESVLLGTKDE